MQHVHPCIFVATISTTYVLEFIVKNEHFMFVAVSDETFHRIFLFHRLKHCFAKLLGSTHMHLID